MLYLLIMITRTIKLIPTEFEVEIIQTLNYDELLSYLDANYHHDLYTNETITSFVDEYRTKNDNSLTFVCCLNTCKLKVFVHEICHIVDRFFYKIGEAKDNNSRGELYAYYVEYIFEQLYELLLEEKLKSNTIEKDGQYIISTKS